MEVNTKFTIWQKYGWNWPNSSRENLQCARAHGCTSNRWSEVLYWTFSSWELKRKIEILSKISASTTVGSSLRTHGKGVWSQLWLTFHARLIACCFTSHLTIVHYNRDVKIVHCYTPSFFLLYKSNTTDAQHFDC